MAFLAISATDKAGHEIDFLFAGCCPCVALMQGLRFLEYFPVNNRFVCIGDDKPFFFRDIDLLVYFVADYAVYGLAP